MPKRLLFVRGSRGGGGSTGKLGLFVSEEEDCLITPQI